MPESGPQPNASDATGATAATAGATGAPLVLRDDLAGDDSGVVTLTLNRPRQVNAMSTAMLDALQATLDAIAVDRTVRVVVIAGAGPNFCAGHDLKEMLDNSNEPFISSLFSRCCDVMQAIERLPQPVIARVHGIATAAGCQLVAACDMAVAADDARFATSGINYGLFCATPAVPVSRNVSRKRAFEMLMTGEFIDAPTALAWGLVNRIVPAAGLDEAVSKLARALMEKPADVVADGKRFFYAQLEQTEGAAYREAAAHITDNMLNDAAQEGVTAFTQKRAPSWRNG
jgi:enoyl-CoA hydratase/carnithine racemase